MANSFPSVIDPDFLLFAFPLAVFLDVFGFISIFYSFGIVGLIVSLVLGIPIVIWMVLKEGDVEAAKERIQSLRKAKNLGAQKKALAQKAMKKGIFKKVLTKGLLRLIVGSLLVFFPYWSWTVFSVLRKR